jgi:hypothetical protein
MREVVGMAKISIVVFLIGRNCSRCSRGVIWMVRKREVKEKTDELEATTALRHDYKQGPGNRRHFQKIRCDSYLYLSICRGVF